MRSAFASPTPKTTLVRPPAKGQRLQASASRSSSTRVVTDGSYAVPVLVPRVRVPSSSGVPARHPRADGAEHLVGDRFHSFGPLPSAHLRRSLPADQDPLAT